MTAFVRPMRHHAGFTLAELSIVLIIIALLTAFLLKGQVFIDSAKSTDLVTTAKDITTAIAEFKSRYHYLPGDLPAASADLAGIASGSACDMPTTTANIGNGQIDIAGEIRCVSQHLSAAGLVQKAAPDGSFNGVFGRVWVMSRESALAATTTQCNMSSGTGIRLLGGAEPMKSTIAVFERVPSEIAQKLDSEFDDGAARTGAIRGSADYANGTTISCFGMSLY